MNALNKNLIYLFQGRRHLRGVAGAIGHHHHSGSDFPQPDEPEQHPDAVFGAHHHRAGRGGADRDPGTDLSAGRQVGLAAVVAATLLQSMDNVNKVFPHMETRSIPLVILLVCAVGAVIGPVNGLIIAYLNVTPFITTLGTMIIVYGINSLYYDSVGASPVAGFDPKFSTFARGFLRFGDFKLSYITFYALIAIIFVWILWTKTRFGKNIFAIGGNPEAARCPGSTCR